LLFVCYEALGTCGGDGDGGDHGARFLSWHGVEDSCEEIEGKQFGCGDTGEDLRELLSGEPSGRKGGEAFIHACEERDGGGGKLHAGTRRGRGEGLRPEKRSGELQVAVVTKGAEDTPHAVGAVLQEEYVVNLIEAF
jgi:hypothetical protein